MLISKRQCQMSKQRIYTSKSSVDNDDNADHRSDDMKLRIGEWSGRNGTLWWFKGWVNSNNTRYGMQLKFRARTWFFELRTESHVMKRILCIMTVFSLLLNRLLRCVVIVTCSHSSMIDHICSFRINTGSEYSISSGDIAIAQSRTSSLHRLSSPNHNPFQRLP
jgi:hypothetical protein